MGRLRGLSDASRRKRRDGFEHASCGGNGAGVCSVVSALLQPPRRHPATGRLSHKELRINHVPYLLYGFPSALLLRLCEEITLPLPPSSYEHCCLRTSISVFSRLASVLMAMFVLLSCALTGDTENTRHVVLATRLGSVRQQRCNTSCFGSFFLSAKPISEKRHKVKPQNARPA